MYELNRIELLRDVFVWAYERSALRYAVVREQLGEPDPFRLRYSAKIRELVSAIVIEGMDRDAARQSTVSYAAEHIDHEDQLRFAEVVKAEVLALHEGNIARYRIRPSEFARWRDVWGSQDSPGS